MNYKKIVMSASTIAFVTALVIGGTGAFFSDTETSAGNVFTAGAIDLTVDSEQHYNGKECILNDGNNQDQVPYVWGPGNSPWPVSGTACDGTWEATDLGAQKFFNFDDVKPGDEGENTISLHVDSNDAYACVDVTLTKNDDVSTVEPELEAGDTENTASLFDGELAQNMTFFAWADTGAIDGYQGKDNDATEGDNVWQANELPLFSNISGPAIDVLDGNSYTLADSNVGPLVGGSTSYIGLAWCAGTIDASVAGVITCDGGTMGNIAQTDSMEATIAFRIEQARNNPNFECGDIPGTDVDAGRELVGAALAGASFSYEAPATCNFTVPTNYATPALAEADTVNVSDGSIVCVDTGTYGEFVVDRPLTFVGLNDPSGASAAVITPSAASDYGINIGANNVTIKGLKIDGAGATFTGNHIAGIRVLTDILNTNVSGARILQNVVTDLHHTNKTAIGIQLYADAAGAEDIIDADIIGNHVTNIKSDTKGAHGVQVVNDLSDVMISQNTVSDIDGGWETGVAVDGNVPANTSDVTITNNQIASASFSVQIEAKVKSSEVRVNNNNLDTLLYGGSSHVGSAAVLDAENNWWGTATPAIGTDVFSDPIGNVVDFTPFEVTALPNN